MLRSAQTTPGREHVTASRSKGQGDPGAVADKAKQEQHGTPIATWVPPALADRLRTIAEAEDRTVSAVVRRALAIQLQDSEEAGTK